MRVDLKEYYEALKKAWEEYWKAAPPWYAALESLHEIINRYLGEDLSLEEHLKYIRELAKFCIVEYWYGGLDPKKKHWVKLKKK